MDEAPIPALRSRRQQIMDVLSRRQMSFEELRFCLESSRRALDEDLRHISKTLRSQSRRLVVMAATCQKCDFVFKGREEKHFHGPSRCPTCRSERISGPFLKIEESK